MKKEYDFSKSVKNPYVKKLKKQISINLDVETTPFDNYFLSSHKIYVKKWGDYGV